jgi:NAD(P)-dependent dehydrogenase (short-subunit alcohol dehydrogenase family)
MSGTFHGKVALVTAAAAGIGDTIATSEQAEAILWLCSDSAAMVTGHVLPVDGGWMARC